MQIAPKTVDEIDRLQALYDYDVLDTEAEKVFDDLTLLASQICETPITLISLVDPDRQWFKSKVGIDAIETSRDIAFCAHAIHQANVFEVEDTLQDERFFDNPLVTSEPKIRFYAGTPLLSPNGHAIGTLCVIDNKPNKLSAQQKQSLEILGRSVISQMELRKKIKELKVAGQHKTDFLSNMSHELRTPLNAIINFSHLLLDKTNQYNIPAKFTEYLQHIDYSGKRLLNVVNSVLDINKIEAGKMPVTFKMVNFRELIAHLEGMLSIGAKEKNIAFTTIVKKNVPIELNIDEAIISQIVTNLVHNAIKFTPSGSMVKTTFNYQKHQLEIRVVDQGVGISAQDQEKLFNQFQQVGQANNQQGSGLGLSIVSSLVELLRGEIQVNSALNSGSQFKVVLPIPTITKHNNKMTTSALEHSFSKKANILLVEDNEINQAVMAAIFESIGLQLTLADTGEEAIKKAQETQFDLVLMDIHLPGIDGREATKIIKNFQPKLVVVALTADIFGVEDVNYPNTLWQEYLTKPLEKDKLIQVLNHYIPENQINMSTTIE